MLYVVLDDSQSVVTLTSDLDLLSHQLYSRTAAEQKFNNCNSIFVLGKTLAIAYTAENCPRTKFCNNECWQKIIVLGQNIAITSAGKNYTMAKIGKVGQILQQHFIPLDKIKCCPQKNYSRTIFGYDNNCRDSPVLKNKFNSNYHYFALLARHLVTWLWNASMWTIREVCLHKFLTAWVQAFFWLFFVRLLHFMQMMQ